MTEEDPRLIEFPVRFSESKLWQIQRNYFASMGIEAWKEEVPYYISSNTFVGFQYALLVINYIQDIKRNHPHAKYDTFYIAELGAGTGKFSFYFLKAFSQLLEMYQLTEQHFCYIITDIVENNLQFCQDNPSFSTFIKNGQLDFALFNVEDDQDFHLRLKNQPYSKLHAKGPLVIIGNYTFDCVRQDIFEFKEGKIQELKVGLRSRYKNFDIEKSKHLNDLRFDYQAHDIEPKGYYQNPYLNQIFQDYAKKLKDQEGYIMFPLGAFAFLDNINAITKGHYFLIVGDKGVSRVENISLFDKAYRFSYDGCYSFNVNLHSMGEYLKKQGGSSLLTANNNNFKVNVFAMGDSFEELKNTKACFHTSLERLGPDEYCYLYDEYLTNSFRFAIRSIISFLRLSQWDPNAYCAIHDRLLELLPVTDKLLVEELKSDLDKVANNVYHLKIGEDVYLNLGIFYQSQGLDEKALAMYQQSLVIYGDTAAAHNNTAILYEKARNITKALDHYEKSYALDKKNAYAYRKITQLTGKPNFSVIYPILKLVLVFGCIFFVLYLLSLR